MTITSDYYSNTIVNHDCFLHTLIFVPVLKILHYLWYLLVINYLFPQANIYNCLFFYLRFYDKNACSNIFVGGKLHVGRYSDRDNDRSNMLQMTILYFNAISKGVGHSLTYDNCTLCSLCELMHNKLPILFLFRPQRWSADKKRHIFIHGIIFGSNEDFRLIVQSVFICFLSITTLSCLNTLHGKYLIHNIQRLMHFFTQKLV